jgi:hypothetical protein
MVHEHAPSEHAVCLYREVGELAGPVAAFLAEGLAAGEPAVVVATPAHWQRFAQALHTLGWSTAELERDGRLVVADAATTLAAVLDAGKPSAQHFERVIGSVLDRAAGGDRTQSVRVFGEMVDLLSERGDAAGASALEDLWNELRTHRPFSLLCAYAVDLFDREAQVGLLPDVCRTHSHVAPASDADRLQQAVDHALTQTLGAYDAEKVYAVVAAQAREQRVPASQLALMWVSAHMPKTAERILEAARTHYGDAALPA